MYRDPFQHISWRRFRLGALLILLPTAVVLVPSTALLVRITVAPLDVTRIAARWTPIAIEMGIRPGHPAGRLTWSKVSVQWLPGHRGRSLLIAAEDLRILRQNGSAALQVTHARMALPMVSLMRGRLAPRALEARGGHVALRRFSENDVDLDLPGHRPPHGGKSAFVVDELHRALASDIDVTYASGASAGEARLLVHVDKLDGTRGEAAHNNLLWTGALNAVARAPAGGTIRLIGAARAVMLNGVSGVSWNLDTTPCEPTAFAAFLPVLDRWHAPVTFAVEGVETQGARGGVLRPIDGLAINRLSAAVTLGAGTISQRDAPPLMVMGGKAALNVTPTAPGARAARVVLRQADLTLTSMAGVPTRFSASAEFLLSDLVKPRKIHAIAHAEGTDFEVQALSAIWPVNIMKGARRWATRNIISGHGRGLAVTSVLESASGWDGLQPTAMYGSLHIDDGTLYWLRPVRPAEHVSADLGFARPDVLRVEVRKGEQRADDAPDAPTLRLSNGEILIDNLFGRDQNGTFSLDFDGDVDAYFRLLSVPRLHLLSRTAMPFDQASGPLHARATLKLPLATHIRDEDIRVQVAGAYHDIYLGHLVIGRSVDGLKGTLQATERALDVSASGLLSGVPTTATMHQEFHHNAPNDVIEDVHAVADLDPQSALKARLGPEGLFDGHASLTAHLTRRASRQADLDLSLDMQDASVELPVWRKVRGTPATAGAHIRMQDNHIVTISDMNARGVDLDMTGHAVVARGNVSGVELDGFHIGRSSGDARIMLPVKDGAPFRVNVNAFALDLTPLFQPGQKAGDAPPTAPPPPKTTSGAASSSSGPHSQWILDLRTRQLFFGQNRALGDVTAHLENIDGSLRFATIDCVYPSRTRVQLRPQGRTRHLVMTVQNLGTMLAGTSLFNRIRGGSARLEGTLENATGSGMPPFAGKLTIGAFDFTRPPDAVTAASHLSPFDWSKADSKHFQVEHLDFPLSMRDGKVSIRDGQLGNASLGATIHGSVDLDTTGLDLQGTVVPIFAVNALPGRLPGVGKLFSPEKGGGFLAATFAIGGVADNPLVHINPFSVFLPGVMRTLVE